MRFIILLCCLVLTPMLHADEAGKHTVVDISLVEGDVTYRLSPRDTWQPATEGTVLKVLAQVATGPDSRAEIRHKNGIVRIIGEKEMVSVYEVITDARPIHKSQWKKTAWGHVCRMLDEKKELLEKVDVVSGTRGDYRVDWANYNLAALYWKDDNTSVKLPTRFHVISAIAAMEAMMETADQDQDKAELAYLIAECEFIAGNDERAARQFKNIVKTYPGTPWSEKAKQRQ